MIFQNVGIGCDLKTQFPQFMGEWHSVDFNLLFQNCAQEKFHMLILWKQIFTMLQLTNMLKINIS